MVAARMREGPGDYNSNAVHEQIARTDKGKEGSAVTRLHEGWDYLLYKFYVWGGLRR